MEVIKETESTPVPGFEAAKEHAGTLRIGEMENFGLNSTQQNSEFVSPRMSFDGVMGDM